MEWTDEAIQRLRDFWAEGVSTAEIGRRLGASKNAVVGKAHRLDLTARPSPIRWDTTGSETPRRRNRRPAEASRPEGPTLPPLGSATPEPIAFPVPHAAAPGVSVAQTQAPRASTLGLVPAPPTAAPAVAAAPRPLAPAPQPRLQAAPTTRSYGRIVTCCWPLGEPGTKGFHFCDSVSVPGKPYCEEHVQLAYVKVRDRREDAA
jgi:GcrA cell cycle regulator